MSRNDDLQIVAMLRERKTRDEGFRLLMNTYKEKIYWHIRRLVVSHQDAEDILQETFINAYRYAGSFKGESRLYTWLYRIATNECIRYFKKAQKQCQNVEMDEKMINSFVINDAENEESILVKFQKAIMKLPEKQRIVFNMRYYDELSYKEMGEILNSSENALKTNYHYATEKIKACLKEE
ncbi:MAG: RNA polymerase sigma factor [Tangfeifania sp.]